MVASVGTDHHPFDRLVRWVDAWAADHGGDVRVVVQHGTASPPAVAEGHALIPRDRLHELVAAATVVVSHGGPSTIVEACRLGRVPVVVPRDPALGEHVDGHQQRFARLMTERGLIRLADDEDRLRGWLDEDLAHGAPRPRVELPDPAAGAARLARVVEDLLAP